MAESFLLRGYIEGYYGKAHTHQERLGLFEFLKGVRMNAYMYAPKDDPLHRGLWRTPYPAADLRRFKDLARKADKCGIKFIYAMSPALINKYNQLRRIGISHFALLMDDIPAQLCPLDKKTFKRPGVAQAYLGNLVKEKLNGCELLFCPTEYCSAHTGYSERTSQYLQDISVLDPEIRAFWTGPQVVAEKITGAMVADASETMRRKLVIWDNYHANDYTPSRVFLGPVSGRDASLRKYAEGFLTNMTEYLNLNKIPLLTVADYARDPAGYNPEASWKRAAAKIEPKAFKHLSFAREFFDGPYSYGKKALVIAARMRSQRVSAKEGGAIIELLSDTTNAVQDRGLFNELSRFIHILLGDFNIYLRFIDPEVVKDELFRKWYCTRKSMTGLAVDSLINKVL